MIWHGDLRCAQHRRTHAGERQTSNAIGNMMRWKLNAVGYTVSATLRVQRIIKSCMSQLKENHWYLYLFGQIDKDNYDM